MARARRAAIYLLLAVEGKSKSAVAKRLNLRASLVQYHARQLEEQGVIRRLVGKSPILYERGPRADLFEASLHDTKSDRGVRSPNRTPAHLHRGHRSFRVLSAPADPATVPGLLRAHVASRVPNFRYGHRDAAGRLWAFQYVAGRGRRSVIAYPPAVVSTDPDVTESAPEWWDGYVAKEAHAWAAARGFDLERARPRHSAPIEAGVVLGLPKQGVVGQDPVVVDDTPKPGTLEADPRTIAAVQRLPDYMTAADARARELHARLDAVEAAGQQNGGLIDRLVRVAEGQVRRERGLVEAAVAQVAPPDSWEVA